ncbi:DUF1592 domain-containing protein [Sorangium sp. So ce341]|uniref:DUF1592 domain-containing protein n=1 Tax=Sorangium sp. So ce341 TaxID=3133302 RepID=UPI003F5E3208
MLKGVLSSPYFLYRTEIDAPSDEARAAFRLTGHEIAAFLSYSVLGAPPSAALVAAADRGELAEPAPTCAAARRSRASTCASRIAAAPTSATSSRTAAPASP